MSKHRFFLFTGFVFLFLFIFFGFGFSFWTFNKDARQDLMFHVYITETALAGSFTTPGMPVYAILDEGMGNINSTITGVSFYKGGTMTIDGITFNEEHIIDTDLSISFLTNQAFTEEEVNQLEFGLRVSTTGKLSTYLRKTSYYTLMEKQTHAPKDGKGEYIDLKALAQTPNYDGSSNYSCNKQADGRWKIVFHFSMIMLDSFYTYQEGKTPDSKQKFDALKEDLKFQTGESQSSFLLELWQGW